MTIKRTSHTDSHFQELVQLLDADLAERDGEENLFYAQFNGITQLNHAIVLYQEKEPLGCGAFKPFDEKSVEIKRMFVREKARGQGLAGEVLKALEDWAKELGYTRTVLETGKRQPEAIRLYQKHDYRRVENFGPYKGIENSLCFAKMI